jgi:hypothetical protein
MLVKLTSVKKKVGQIDKDKLTLVLEFYEWKKKQFSS